MKKFKFRLERVLRYRKALKNEALRELMEKNRVVDELEFIIDKLAKELDTLQMEKEKGLFAEHIYMINFYRGRIMSEIENTTEKLFIAIEEAEQALISYMEKAKDEKALATLREHRKEEYMDLAQKEEGKFLDELATQKGNTFLTDGGYHDQ